MGLAHQKLAEEKCKTIEKSISEHEGYALKALEQSNDDLAREVAVKIADLENQLSQEKESEAGYKQSADSLRQAVKQAEANIKRIKQQVDTVKATESVQRAQAAVAERHSGTDSKLRTAMESLERIKEKQALKSAQMSAAKTLAEENQDTSLQDKLEAAGISASGKNADDVLARLNNKQ